MFDFVFIASGLDGANRGGIQYSAQIAWEGLQAQGGRGALLSYGDVPLGAAGDGDRIVASRSQFALLRQTLSQSWDARQVLVWHLGLVKLLPFLRTGAAPVSLFLHGIEAWQPLGLFSKRCLSRVGQFLTNSAFTWQRFVDLNPRLGDRPHTVVPLGIGKAAAVVGEPSDPPAALMLGRLLRAEAYKGHREVLAAWPRVRERIPGAELWIAGDGDLRADLERSAGAGVIFFGRVSEEKKAEMLAGCRCLALPSRGEGFGLVYLEALRLGRPCLVSDRDAGREVVHPPEAGLAVDPGDAAAVAAALVRLLSAGTEWDDWSAAARRRYAARFTASQFQGRLLEAVLQTPLGRMAAR